MDYFGKEIADSIIYLEKVIYEKSGWIVDGI